MVQSEGGSESFERFFAATKDHVYRSLPVITRDQALADDGVAEAYARAFERLDEVANHPVPKAWVARTALNYVRSDRRQTRRVIFGVPDVPAPERDLPDPLKGADPLKGGGPALTGFSAVPVTLVAP